MNNNMTTDKPMSNEEVIEVLKGIVFNGFDRTTRKERHALDFVIKALEERPQGRWAKTGQSFINPNKFRNFCCSNCFWELDEHIRVEPNFCPNCGADMRKGGVK